MGVILKNNAVSTITTAISASDVGLAVAAGTGALFPVLGVSDYFYATLVSAGGTYEVIKVTARVGDTMTIVRAQEGTTAQSFASGSRIEVRVTAASIQDMLDYHDQASEISFAPTGSVSASNVQDAIAEVDSEAAKVSTLTAGSGSAGIGFTAIGGSAVVRTVQAKLREAVSVKDFGAVGDGSADDTAAINAAIAAVSGQNTAYVYFPEGLYKVTSSINVNRNQISLVGAGMSATVIRCHADGVNVFDVRRTAPDPISNVVISDMQIDIGGGVSTTTGAGIYLERAVNTIIDNVSLGSHQNSLQIMGCFNVLASNIIISYGAGSPNNRNGVYVSKSSASYLNTQCANIFINNMTATGGGQPLDTVTPGAAYGILFDSVDGLWVNNSYFGYFNQASACGNLLNENITGIKFDNTWLDASRNFCLWLKGSGSGVTGLHEFVGLRMVGGPNCTYNAYIEGLWGGIHFNGGHAEQTISHNVAVTSTGSNIIFDGFNCVGSPLRASQACMYFNGPDYVRIVGCSIDGGTTTATLYGFYINDGTGHVVVGNTITNCAIAGLFDGAADFWTASDNMDATTTNTFAITNSSSGAYYYLMNIGQKSTGWGTPTGASKIANFPGATATLTQCSQTVAQLITELKSTGLLAD